MGPWITTADEVTADDLQLQTWVNGELRQNANTRDLIFDIPNLIETLSAGMMLQPGDVIATGTPAGVGLGFDPPRFLRPGDEVTVTISGLGTLRNPFA
jgi:2-keto-4-pentenoate hydratase/2-oxohepta-3-ene-1,7-dioic acid hydratase in catechol pathway